MSELLALCFTYFYLYQWKVIKIDLWPIQNNPFLHAPAAVTPVYADLRLAGTAGEYLESSVQTMVRRYSSGRLFIYLFEKWYISVYNVPLWWTATKATVVRIWTATALTEEEKHMCVPTHLSSLHKLPLSEMHFMQPHVPSGNHFCFTRTVLSQGFKSHIYLVTWEVCVRFLFNKHKFNYNGFVNDGLIILFCKHAYKIHIETSQ